MDAGTLVKVVASAKVLRVLLDEDAKAADSVDNLARGFRSPCMALCVSGKVVQNGEKDDVPVVGFQPDG